MKKEVNGIEIADCTPVVLSKSDQFNFLYYYAWADEKLQTWFITKNKKSPKAGTRILYLIQGLDTDKPLFTATTYPTVGDVVATVNNEIIEIKNCLFY